MFWRFIKADIIFLNIYFLLIIEDTLAFDNDQTAGEKFVEHAKELGADTKDVLLNTVANVQHALETAGDYIQTQSSSTTAENTEKTTEKDQNDLIQQASSLKDILVQKAIDAKDATIDVIKDITSPPEQSPTVSFQQNSTTVMMNKKTNK